MSAIRADRQGGTRRRGTYSAGDVRAPIRVVFTDHAAERAVRYGISFDEIADAILDEHDRRQRNPGSGDWLVRGGRLTVIYNWPDGQDATTARVVTVWQQE